MMYRFRLYTKLRFNRPVDKRNDLVAFDGVSFVIGGEPLSFDFMDIASYIDKDDPTLVHTVMEDPDYESTPKLFELTADMLRSISEIEDIGVCTLGETQLLEKGFEEVTFEAFEAGSFGQLIKIDDSIVEEYNKKLNLGEA